MLTALFSTLWFRAAGVDARRRNFCGETLAQAHRQAIPRATGDDHRQAGILRRSSGGNAHEFRASPAQGAKQSGGEFASADEAARDDHEAVQIRKAPSAICLHPRSDRRNPIANLHNFPRHAISSSDYRALRSEAMIAWREKEWREIAELSTAS